MNHDSHAPGTCAVIESAQIADAAITPVHRPARRSRPSCTMLPRKPRHGCLQVQIGGELAPDWDVLCWQRLNETEPCSAHHLSRGPHPAPGTQHDSAQALEFIGKWPKAVALIKANFAAKTHLILHS